MKAFLVLCLGLVALEGCGQSDSMGSSKGGAGGAAGAAGSSSGGVAGKGTGGVASGGSAGKAPTAPDCSKLESTESVASLEARIDQFEKGLQQQGFNVTLNGGVDIDHVAVSSIQYELPSSSEPATSALDFLTKLPDSPFQATEYEVAETKSSFASQTVIFKRHQVGGVQTQFGRAGLVVTVEKGVDGVWRLLAFHFEPSVVYASAADVEKLVACTSNDPPSLSEIFAFEFQGLLLEWCGPAGGYVYTPKDGDQVEWQDSPIWQAFPAEVVRWRVVRKAHFVMHPKNYFADIGKADCICDDQAGYTMTVDFVSGEVLDYTPGINCVVC